MPVHGCAGRGGGGQEGALACAVSRGGSSGRSPPDQYVCRRPPGSYDVSRMICSKSECDIFCRHSPPRPDTFRLPGRGQKCRFGAGCLRASGTFVIPVWRKTVLFGQSTDWSNCLLYTGKTWNHETGFFSCQRKILTEKKPVSAPPAFSPNPQLFLPFVGKPSEQHVFRQTVPFSP